LTIEYFEVSNEVYLSLKRITKKDMKSANDIMLKHGKKCWHLGIHKNIVDMILHYYGSGDSTIFISHKMELPLPIIKFILEKKGLL